jgi:hypothetical protein
MDIGYFSLDLMRFVRTGSVSKPQFTEKPVRTPVALKLNQFKQNLIRAKSLYFGEKVAYIHLEIFKAKPVHTPANSLR